jgi:Sigma-70 region 2
VELHHQLAMDQKSLEPLLRGQALRAGQQRQPGCIGDFRLHRSKCNKPGLPTARALQPFDIYKHLTQAPRVFNYFRFRLGREADVEDLTARTFERAWRSRAQYRRDLAGFPTWLFKIAQNVRIDFLKSNRGQHLPIDTVEELPADGTPETDAERESDLMRLSKLTQYAASVEVGPIAGVIPSIKNIANGTYPGARCFSTQTASTVEGRQNQPQVRCRPARGCPCKPGGPGPTPGKRSDS